MNFFAKKITYLGYTIEKDKLTICTDKLRAVSLFPRPMTIKKLQQFLGLSNHYRKFIKNYAIIAKPLYTLLKNGNKLIWNTKELIAFSEIKQKLITSPVLRMPDLQKRFYIYTDASSTGLGAVLCQRKNMDEFVVAFASRLCNIYEQKYTAYDLEALVIDFALKGWRCYLLNSEFTLYTNNSALTFLQNKKEKSERLHQLLSRIEKYNFIITHKPARQNRVADILSRNAININNIEGYGDPELTYENKNKIILEHYNLIGHAIPVTTYKSIKIIIISEQ